MIIISNLIEPDPFALFCLKNSQSIFNFTAFLIEGMNP